MKLKLRQTNQAKDVVTDLRPLTENPTIAGNAVTGQKLVTAKVLRVEHGLSRKPIGYIVTRALGNAPVFYELEGSDAADDKTISFHGGSNSTLDFWFF